MWFWRSRSHAPAYRRRWWCGADPWGALFWRRSVENSQTVQAPSSADDALKQFIARVLASTEDVWTSYFTQMGKACHASHLQLFSEGIRACRQLIPMIVETSCTAAMRVLGSTSSRSGSASLMSALCPCVRKRATAFPAVSIMA